MSDYMGVSPSDLAALFNHRAEGEDDIEARAEFLNELVNELTAEGTRTAEALTCASWIRNDTDFHRRLDHMHMKVHEFYGDNPIEHGAADIEGMIYVSMDDSEEEVFEKAVTAMEAKARELGFGAPMPESVRNELREVVHKSYVLAHAKESGEKSESEIEAEVAEFRKFLDAHEPDDFPQA